MRIKSKTCFHNAITISKRSSFIELNVELIWIILDKWENKEWIISRMNHVSEEVQIAEFSVDMRIKVFANTNLFIFEVLLLKIYNFSKATCRYWILNSMPFILIYFIIYSTTFWNTCFSKLRHKQVKLHIT